MKLALRLPRFRPRKTPGRMPCNDPSDRALIELYLALTTRLSLSIYETRHLLGYPGNDATPWVRLLLVKGRPPLHFERERMKTALRLACYADEASKKIGGRDPFQRWFETPNPVCVEGKAPRAALVLGGKYHHGFEQFAFQ